MVVERWYFDNWAGHNTKIMRYNIKRLFNEIVTHQKDLKRFKELYAASPDYGEIGCSRSDLSSQINSKNHAISLCKKFIGDEVVTRWKEGTNLNVEAEDTPLVKFI